MVQTIKISNAEMNLINDLLNLTGDEISLERMVDKYV